MRVRRYDFRVRLEATVTVLAARAADAHDALDGLLGGAMARVVSGAGEGLDLVEMETSADATLLLVDGVDPMAPLMTALSDWRANVRSNRSGT